MHLFCKLCLKLGKSGLFNDESRNDNDQSEKLTEQMEHARIHYRHLQIIGGNGKTMEAVFEQCFSNKEEIDKLSAKSGNEKLDRGSLTEFCHTIIKDVPNKNYLWCDECGTELKIRSAKGSLNFFVIIEHAYSHLGKKLFFCRHCDHGTTTSNAIVQHIRKVHKLSSQRNEYVDLSKDHEIQAMLKRCFSGKHLPNKTLSKEEKLKIRTNNCLKSFYHGSPFLNERHTLILDLIRKYENESRTLRCRLCSKNIYSGTTSKFPINHALTHLDKPVYRCKRCSKTSTNFMSMVSHLKLLHKLPSASREYDDRSEDFHKEILDILRKCYDAEMNTK